MSEDQNTAFVAGIYRTTGSNNNHSIPVGPCSSSSITVRINGTASSCTNSNCISDKTSDDDGFAAVNSTRIPSRLYSSRDYTQEDDEWNTQFHQWIGQMRITSEIRQLGAVIAVLGIGTTYSTFALLSHLLHGKSGASQIEGFQLPVIVGNFLQAVSGVTSIGTGMACVLYNFTTTSSYPQFRRRITMPFEFTKRQTTTRTTMISFNDEAEENKFGTKEGSFQSQEDEEADDQQQQDDMYNAENDEKRRRMFHKWAKWFVAIVNLGPIALVITIVQLSMGTHQKNHMDGLNTTTTTTDSYIDFIPSSLQPTNSDTRFVVAMGLISLISVCSTLIGGLTVSGLQLCAYLANQPHARNKYYHIIRYGYYCFLVCIGGLSQLLLGCFLWFRYGPGPYFNANDAVVAIHVATYTIHIPLVAILVGLAQTIMGIHGFGRAVGWYAVGGPSDKSYQLCVLGTWIISTFLQFLFQPAYADVDEDDYAAEGATVACVYLGFFVMPLYLDYLVRHTAIRVRPEDYGLPADAPSGRPDVLVSYFYGKDAASQSDWK